MRKTLPLSACPEDFKLTERTIETIERDYPTIDIEKTRRKFVLQAEAKGWMYKNWQSAFVNYCDNGERYGGVVYKQGRSQDPRWTPILSEVAPYGFREPYPHETPDSYRTAFNLWKSQQNRAPVSVDLRNALRAIK